MSQHLETVFHNQAMKVNKDFDLLQFKQHNGDLYRIIMYSMGAIKEEIEIETVVLRKIIDDDTDYKAMRLYAKSLEAKLGIDPDKHK